jgi:uncharacterized membrane protein SpoIIM required for sporulation
MDIDAFVAAHRGEWDRLDQLSRRSGRLSGAEVDELVDLYQRAATHLSAVRSAAPDPALVGRLSSLLARSRGAVTGGRAATVRDLSDFFLVRFPAAVYRARWWWITTGALFVVVALALGWWVADNPDVQAQLLRPAEVRQLVDQDFASYYRSNPAGSFAFHVWTNNAWLTALSVASGGLLGLPIPFLLAQNAANVGVIGGYLAAHGRLDLFFGLILPHGMLELTAVFVGAGVGLRLGWTIISPGGQTRTVAVAREGRAAITVALGLVAVLAVSGVIEAFVTPSPLPTWARIGIGLLAWAGFIAYVFVLGRRAALAGETGDLDSSSAGDVLPVSVG